MSEVTLGQGLISATVLGFLSSRIWEREREELRRDAPPICWPSCQTRRSFLQSWSLLLFYVWISGVLWLCVRERMKRREPERRWIKGGNRDFFSRGSEVYSVINTHETKYTEIPCSVSFWVHDSWEIWLLGELETWCFCWLAVNSQFNKIDYSSNISAVLPVIITLNTPR